MIDSTQMERGAPPCRAEGDSDQQSRAQPVICVKGQAAASLG